MHQAMDFRPLPMITCAVGRPTTTNRPTVWVRSMHACATPLSLSPSEDFTRTREAPPARMHPQSDAVGGSSMSGVAPADLVVTPVLRAPESFDTSRGAALTASKRENLNAVANLSSIS